MSAADHLLAVGACVRLEYVRSGKQFVPCDFVIVEVGRKVRRGFQGMQAFARRLGSFGHQIRKKADGALYLKHSTDAVAPALLEKSTFSSICVLLR